MALGAALFFIISAFPAWLAINGLRTGFVWARGARYSRSEEPILFWLTVAIYMGLVAFIWFEAVGLSLAVGF